MGGYKNSAALCLIHKIPLLNFIITLIMEPV